MLSCGGDTIGQGSGGLLRWPQQLEFENLNAKGHLIPRGWNTRPSHSCLPAVGPWRVSGMDRGRISGEPDGSLPTLPSRAFRAMSTNLSEWSRETSHGLFIPDSSPTGEETLIQTGDRRTACPGAQQHRPAGPNAPTPDHQPKACISPASPQRRCLKSTY